MEHHRANASLPCDSLPYATAVGPKVLQAGFWRYGSLLPAVFPTRCSGRFMQVVWRSPCLGISLHLPGVSTVFIINELGLNGKLLGEVEKHPLLYNFKLLGYARKNREWTIDNTLYIPCAVRLTCGAVLGGPGSFPLEGGRRRCEAVRGVRTYPTHVLCSRETYYGPHATAASSACRPATTHSLKMRQTDLAGCAQPISSMATTGQRPRLRMCPRENSCTSKTERGKLSEKADEGFCFPQFPSFLQQTAQHSSSGGNGRFPSKPADQRCRPAQFPFAKIRCDSARVWWEASSLTAQQLQPQCIKEPVSTAKLSPSTSFEAVGAAHDISPAVTRGFPFLSIGSQDLDVESRPNLFTPLFLSAKDKISHGFRKRLSINVSVRDVCLPRYVQDNCSTLDLLLPVTVRSVSERKQNGPAIVPLLHCFISHAPKPVRLQRITPPPKSFTARDNEASSLTAQPPRPRIPGHWLFLVLGRHRLRFTIRLPLTFTEDTGTAQRYVTEFLPPHFPVEASPVPFWISMNLAPMKLYTIHDLSPRLPSPPTTHTNTELSCEVWTALNEVLRADDGEMRGEWSSAGMQGGDGLIPDVPMNFACCLPRADDPWHLLLSKCGRSLPISDAFLQIFPRHDTEVMFSQEEINCNGPHPKLPSSLRGLFSCSSKVKKRGNDKGNTNMHPWRLIAPTRMACSISVPMRVMRSEYERRRGLAPKKNTSINSTVRHVSRMRKSGTRTRFHLDGKRVV
ncbi:hypothetical protein PR048_031706 [Dryococelus australis]|uniref:Uncharacterized protein n=1 Tax=Dryococelus australis TaxID=614101 RepID=A0ABQ9GA16_9NEOP|nr:hypothetical protein PR048_031706 [Dryococelus australis]